MNKKFLVVAFGVFAVVAIGLVMTQDVKSLFEPAKPAVAVQPAPVAVVPVAPVASVAPVAESAPVEDCCAAEEATTQPQQRGRMMGMSGGMSGGSCGNDCK